MDNIELFDDFINDNLSEKERHEFKNRLQSDKDFASEFKMYCLSIIGISKEVEQDNRDFGEAMKRISKEDLLDIIGAKKKKFEEISSFKVSEHFMDQVLIHDDMAFNEESAEFNSSSSSPIFHPPYNSENTPKSSKLEKPTNNFKKWLFWQSIGVAALLGLGIIYIIIAKKEANTVRQNALDKVDNTIYAFSDYSQGISRGSGIDIYQLSDEELRTQLPALESNFREQADDIDVAEFGSELVMTYIRLHERDKAKQLLTELITRFRNNSDFEDDIINWQTILSLLQ